jgi:hypothetical protein
MSSFFQKRYQKIIGAIAGTIILGALGSGLWESALKPVLGSTRDVALNVISFGMISIKNSSYSQTAKDLHEETSLSVLFYVILAVVLLNVVLIASSFYQSRQTRKSFQEFKTKLAKWKSGESDRYEDLQKEKEELIAKGERLIQKYPGRVLTAGTWVTSLLLVLTMSMVVSDFIRFSYVNSAISYYHQLDAITAPFIDQSERVSLRSKFAQIKSKQDYVTIIQRLQSIAKENGQAVPDFSIW